MKKKLIYFLFHFLIIFSEKKDKNIFIEYFKENKKSIIFYTIFHFINNKYNIINKLTKLYDDPINENEDNKKNLSDNNLLKHYKDAEKFIYFFNKSLNENNNFLNNTNYLKTVFLIGDENIDKCENFVKLLKNKKNNNININFEELDFNEKTDKNNIIDTLITEDQKEFILNKIRITIESLLKTDTKKILHIKGLENFICDEKEKIDKNKKEITQKLSNLINTLNQEKNNNLTLIISLPNENNLDKKFKLNTIIKFFEYYELNKSESIINENNYIEIYKNNEIISYNIQIKENKINENYITINENYITINKFINSYINENLSESLKNLKKELNLYKNKLNFLNTYQYYQNNEEFKKFKNIANLMTFIINKNPLNIIFKQ